MRVSRGESMNRTVYVRQTLCEVLIAHQRLVGITACACGWSDQRGSFADHIADEYEKLGSIGLAGNTSPSGKSVDASGEWWAAPAPGVNP